VQSPRHMSESGRKVGEGSTKPPGFTMPHYFYIYNISLDDFAAIYTTRAEIYLFTTGTPYKIDSRILVLASTGQGNLQKKSLSGGIPNSCNFRISIGRPLKKMVWKSSDQWILDCAVYVRLSIFPYASCPRIINDVGEKDPSQSRFALTASSLARTETTSSRDTTLLNGHVRNGRASTGSWHNTWPLSVHLRATLVEKNQSICLLTSVGRGLGSSFLQLSPKPQPCTWAYDYR
jgi:hypothetical protein